MVAFDRHRIVSLPRLVKRGEGLKGPARRLLDAALFAEARDCDALVYVQDADNRGSAIRAGLEDGEVRFRERHPDSSLRIVLGVATQTIEGWLLTDGSLRTTLGIDRNDVASPIAPEDLWGAKGDANGDHPTQVLRRAAEKARRGKPGVSLLVELAGAQDPVDRAVECPQSFGPFRDQLRDRILPALVCSEPADGDSGSA